MRSLCPGVKGASAVVVERDIDVCDVCICFNECLLGVSYAPLHIPPLTASPKHEQSHDSAKGSYAVTVSPAVGDV